MYIDRGDAKQNDNDDAMKVILLNGERQNGFVFY